MVSDRQVEPGNCPQLKGTYKNTDFHCVNKYVFILLLLNNSENPRVGTFRNYNSLL